MIIVQIKGGLGNQMFQYSLARKLSILNNNAPIRFDDFTQKAGVKRTFEIDQFNIVGSKLNDIETYLYKIQKKLGIYKIAYESDNDNGDFKPEVLQLKGNVYINGYWQTHKYFDAIADIIKKDFTLKSSPDEYNSKLLDQINSTESIVIHVRRGDYISNEQTNQYHGTCSIDYYKKGIGIIKSKIKNPHFFIFSDDPKWAEENIPTDAPTTVSYNPPEKGLEDMRLMYSCKHFIIANSTFSWWGAWLSQNPEKIVIAPKQWFKSTEKTGKDIVPAEWTRI